MLLSFVIPALNERPSLAPLLGEIAVVAGATGHAYEVIVVDDGSCDGTWQEVVEIGGRDPRVRGIRLRRNFGKASALDAAFRSALGDVLFTLDADGQDVPAEVPRFLACLDDGYDLVSGWKRKRLDPLLRVVASRIFNWAVSLLTGVRLHDHNCGFKAMRREVAQEVRLYGEMHRFLPALAAARGFRVGEVDVEHRRRAFGKSKYGGRRYLRGALDLLSVTFITGFGRRPLHLFGPVGILLSLCGLAGLGYLACAWFSSSIGQRPLLAYSVAALLTGIQFLSLGLIAELMLAQRSRQEAYYSIAETTGQSTHSGNGSSRKEAGA